MPLSFPSHSEEEGDQEEFMRLAQELEKLTAERRHLMEQGRDSETPSQLEEIEKRRRELRRKIDALG